MSSVQYLREFVNQRLTAAAEEIFGVFEKNIVEYEAELERQRRLLDIVWKPEIKLHRIELPQQHICKEEEEVFTEQLWDQQRNSSLDLEDPETLQIKEEQEEVEVKQETDAFMLIHVHKESEHSEADANSEQQLLSHSSAVAESQDQRGSQDVEPPSTRNVESQPEKSCHSNNVYNSLTAKSQCNTQTEFVDERLATVLEEIFEVLEKAVVTYEEEIDCQRRLLDVVCKPDTELQSIELPQQHVVKIQNFLSEQQLWGQKTNSSLDQEDQDRVTAAAEEIFGVFEKTIVEYEAELDRQRRLLDIVLKPEIKLHKIELPQQCVYDEREVLTEQKLLNQQRSSSLDREDPESSQIKEEQEEVEVKQETDTFMLIPAHKESEQDKTSEAETNSEQQLLSHSSAVAESQDQRGSQRVEPPSTRDTRCKAHKGAKSLKCDICGKMFTWESQLNVHMRIHTGEKPYSCKTCGKTFSQISALNVHVRIHTDEKPFSCTKCGKGFKTTAALLLHVRTHTGEKPYVCNTCRKSFRCSSDLLSHIKTHTGEKPFSCKICGKAFTRNSVLKLHMSTHNDEKPYCCRSCGKRFSKLSLLKLHMRMHTEWKPYSCKICRRNFLSSTVLKAHMRTHTGEKPYACNTCGKKFSRGWSLTAHLKSHSDEKNTLL